MIRQSVDAILTGYGDTRQTLLLDETALGGTRIHRLDDWPARYVDRSGVASPRIDVVTGNARELERVPGVAIEWWLSDGGGPMTS